MYEGIAECWAPFHGDAPLLLGLATGLPCLLWQFALMLTGAESFGVERGGQRRQLATLPG